MGVLPEEGAVGTEGVFQAEEIVARSPALAVKTPEAFLPSCEVS